MTKEADIATRWRWLVNYQRQNGETPKTSAILAKEAEVQKLNNALRELRRRLRTPRRPEND